MKRFLLLCLSLPVLAVGFCPQASSRCSDSASAALSMAPRFDKQLNQWVPTSPDEGPEAGYDIWGTVVRHGPIPFFNRIFKAGEYEQGVLKFMSGDNVDRMTAQAEMDAYLKNPSDWAYNRLKGYNVDYLSIDKKQLTLTLVWSAIVLTLLSRGVYCLATGDYYWDILPSWWPSLRHKSDSLL